VAFRVHHLTKTELAAQFLRERIHTGELAPGERLRVDEFVRELGMSATPIREALRLLQNDQLIDYRPHLGYVVASPAALGEVLRLRCTLEPLAAELAVPVMAADPPILARLEDLQARYAAAVEIGSGTAISESNERWHALINDASGWSHLQSFIRRLWEAFPWRTIWAVPGHSAQSVIEHERVMEAFRAGDAAGAAEGMRAHIMAGEAATSLVRTASAAIALGASSSEGAGIDGAKNML